MKRLVAWFAVVLLTALLPLAFLPAPVQARPFQRQSGAVANLGVTGGAAVFSSSLASSTVEGQSSTWHLTVGVKDGATNSKVKVRYVLAPTASGSSTANIDLTLNSDTALTEGCGYTFTFGVPRYIVNPNGAILYTVGVNVVFETSTTVGVLLLEEVNR